MSDIKKWGPEEFWGLGYEFDPQWLLTPEQQVLQDKLIDLCQRASRMCSRVCGIGPSAALTTRIAPSICAAPVIMFFT